MSVQLRDLEQVMEKGTPCGTRTPAQPPARSRYTSVPDSSHPRYPFPSQNMMIIVVFLRSHKRRVGVQELDDMLAFAKAFGVQGLPAASSVKKFLASLEKEIPLFKPRQYTEEDSRTLPSRGVASRLHRCGSILQRLHWPLSCEARRRIKDALEWMKEDRKELPGVGNELGHKRLVNLLTAVSNEWVGETLINFLIGGIIHTQQLEHTTTILVYGLVASHTLLRDADDSSDVQRLLGQYHFELWLADLARHDCIGIASSGTAEFIRAHPDSEIDVKHGAWSIHNSLSSRTLTVAAALNALEALFKVLNLIIDVNHGTTTRAPQQQDTFSCGPAIVNVVEHKLVHEKPFDPTHAALSRIRQFCRAIDM
ncbi:BQ5605_C011g06620 [Microbotryum silenes-dioicae]|uniref:BQ5605_C011g06620 protein n=1 Tax=Microbotryum silenes-dioicae TaxID=796604 RepID=A0A2X0LU13_9BASI|nr:BQ5605_C011g06620 [Microbotryum silenes-dioicae]